MSYVIHLLGRLTWKDKISDISDDCEDIIDWRERDVEIHLEGQNQILNSVLQTPAFDVVSWLQSAMELCW